MPGSPRFGLSYRVLPGGGGTLLLLHGMAGSHGYFLRPLRDLTGYRRILPDLLGHGDSEKPEAGYTLEDHLGCLADLALREGFPEPLILGGHSMGAALSVALADALPPGAVAGLVLFNLPWFSSALELHHVLREGSEAYRRASEGVVVEREEDVLGIGPEALRSAGNALPATLREGRGPSDAALRGTAYHLLFRFRLDAYANALQRIPSLALLGSGDGVAPAGLARPHLAAYPLARVLLIEGAGHHLIHTHAETVLPEVLKFLDGLGRG
jgi:pimeloyl-ACP methyl ester carboxylesterase